MVHQPYENWLLNDELLKPEQERDLRLHLRSCPQCAALQRANISLRAAPVIGPAPGFALRFQQKLAAQRAVERKRAFLGLFLLVVVGIGMLAYAFAPLLTLVAENPTQVFVTWVSALVYLGTTIQVLGTIGSVFSQVLISIVPAPVWMLAIALGGGLGALWVVSFKKSAKYALSAI